MNTPHRIRLHGPWDYEVVHVSPASSDVAPGQRGRFRLPDHWADALGGDFEGTVRLTRRFNCPTGLGERLSVWLVVEGVDNHADAWLNEHSLGHILGHAEPTELEITAIEIAAFDITERLRDQNLLTLEVTRSTPTGPLVAGVRLEIRES
jgi:beta-galactosidase/beta-glucuronidase